VVIEAGLELTMKAGGSFIKLDAGGVTVLGPRILLNAGGSPGAGSGAATLLPGLPLPASSAKAGNLLSTAQPGVVPPKPEQKPRAYCFDITLTDVPGDDSFPLSHTDWHIVQDGHEAPLLEGITDEDGRINIDESQRLRLSEACMCSGPLWLCYAGQRVPVALLDEPSSADKERYALAALDFHHSARHRTINATNHERSTQDVLADGDLYSRLQPKDE